MIPTRILILDSITRADARARGTVLVNGSHGGDYTGRLALRLGVRAAIFSDAGFGLDDAGVAGLRSMERAGIAAAAVGVGSARIGDGADIWRRGTISCVNAVAATLGVRVGMDCARAADRLLAAADAATAPADGDRDGIVLADAGPPAIWLLDSAASIGADQIGAIVVTGSHGGLLGGRAQAAVKAPVRAVLFNDAGIGADGAGIARLSALDALDIPAATVAAHSARIGDARSTLRTGILSAVNQAAAAAGHRVGDHAARFVQNSRSDQRMEAFTCA